MCQQIEHRGNFGGKRRGVGLIGAPGGHFRLTPAQSPVSSAEASSSGLSRQFASLPIASEFLRQVT